MPSPFGSMSLNYTHCTSGKKDLTDLCTQKHNSFQSITAYFHTFIPVFMGLLSKGPNMRYLQIAF